MKIPDLEILKQSAVAHLRECKADAEAELLSTCKLEIGSVQQYAGGSVGLRTTIRCKSSDLPKFHKTDSRWNDPTENLEKIKKAIDSVLPVEFFIDRISARGMLVDRAVFDASELAELIVEAG
jgi:hypothetical protein